MSFCAAKIVSLFCHFILLQPTPFTGYFFSWFDTLFYFILFYFTDKQGSPWIMTYQELGHKNLGLGDWGNLAFEFVCVHQLKFWWVLYMIGLQVSLEKKRGRKKRDKNSFLPWTIVIFSLRIKKKSSISRRNHECQSWTLIQWDVSWPFMHKQAMEAIQFLILPVHASLQGSPYK